jgi:hypothetical protein
VCPKTQWARADHSMTLVRFGVADSMIFSKILFNRHILAFVISLKARVVVVIWFFFSFSFVGGDVILTSYALDSWNFFKVNK